MAHTKTADGTSFREDIQGLGQGVGEFKDNVNNLAQGAADAARSGIAELRLGARHAVDATKSKIGHAAQAGGEATDSLRGVIGRNPVASIAIAAGVGMLIALFLRRSKD